jgi:hypothetical protein
MDQLLSKNRSLLFVLIVLIIFLQGCASKSPTSSAKIGMHIDAVLEFVVEYPLTWTKDRRLPYGTTNGEVRWTHPDHPRVLLKIRSFKQKELEKSDKHVVDQVLQNFTGIELTLEEQTSLKSGEARHVIGQTTNLNVELYLLSHNKRHYSIELTTPREDSESYQDLIEKVINSFRVISP